MVGTGGLLGWVTHFQVPALQWEAPRSLGLFRPVTAIRTTDGGTMTSTTFRAAVVTKPGEPDAISFLDLPVPPLELGEVRVAVAAATVNPVDVLVRGGGLHRAGVIDQPERTGLG